MLSTELGAPRARGTSPRLTKILAPRLSGWLPRRRLHRQLDDALRTARMLWVSAPAGAGKTYLLASYIAERRCARLWYQIDAGDGDLSSFVYYLGLAAKERDESADSLPLLTPEYAAGREVFLRNFFREIFVRLERPGLIVLDNYQDAPTDAALDKALAIAIRELPAGLTLVVLSRGEMPAALARERAHGEIAVLSEKDLRLDRREIVALARQRGIREIHPGSVRKVQAETHGWFVGVVLLLGRLEKADKPEPERDEHDRAIVFDYFASTHFNDLGGATREFLMNTAFLSPMTAKAAWTLTERADAKEQLEWLVRNHHFTIRTDSQSLVYRYHPLFQQFLRARARHAWTLTRLREVSCLAAELALECGHVEQAVALLRDCNDSDTLEELLVARAPELLAQGRHESLRNWISALPRQQVEDAPWLQYWLAMTRVYSEARAVRSLLVKAYREFRRRGDVRGQYSASIGVMNSLLLGMDDFQSLDPWLAEFDRLRQRHPAFPSAEIEREASAVMFCAKFHRCQNHDDVRESAERALELGRRASDVSVQAQVYQYLGFYDLTFEPSPELADRLKEFGRTVRRDTLRPLDRIRAALALAVYYDDCQDIERCRRAVKAGLALAEESGVLVLNSLLLGHLAWLGLRTADFPEADAAIAHMERQIDDATPWDRAFYFHLESTRCHLRGDLSGAEQFRQWEFDLLNEVNDSLTWHIARFQHALLSIDQGRLGLAHKLVESVRCFAAAHHGRLLLRDCLLADALIETATGDTVAAHDSLRRAFAMGLNLTRRGFVVWPPWMLSGVCEVALAGGIEVAYVVSFIRSTGLRPRDTSFDLEAWPWPVRVYTLGDFRVLRDGEPITFNGKAQKRPLDLLKALIALGGRCVSVERLAEVLWPDAEGDVALRTLKTTLHRLRRLIGDAALDLTMGRLSLNAQQCWVDVQALERRLDRFEQLPMSSDNDMEILETELDETLQRYGGPFLDDEDAPWALPVRERLRSRLLLSIRGAARCFGERGECARVRALYEKGLLVDDVSEQLYRGLMACHAACGDRGAALGVYRRCRRVLRGTLAIAPGDPVESLRLRIQAAGAATAPSTCPACGRCL